MKTVKIRFSGMSGKFDDEHNFIVDILRKRYNVVISDEPDFLFYSQNSRDYLDYNCVRIFYTVENLVPDFNICDYGISFQNLKFEDRYYRYPIYLDNSFVSYKGDDFATDLEFALHKHENPEEILSKKTDFCAYVYSNSQAAQCRQKIYSALSEYKKINSGGRYLNNVGGPVEDKLKFQKKHKFAIAFENTSNNGYTTEKIVQAFAAGTIPIYWGNPNIEKEFNGKSFINCHKYGLTEKCEPEAIEGIIEEVERLDSNEESYIQMLSEPAFAEEFNVEKVREGFENFLYNIFDQEPEEAIRRNRFFWGERYERKQRIGNKFYWQLRKLIPVRDFIRKIVRK